MPNMARRILILEDDPATLQLLEDSLKVEQFETLTAKTAAQARKMLFTAPVDLVVVDRILPDGDGLDLIKEIKTLPCLRHLAVIFLSARSLLQDKLDGLRSGGDDYLVKPFDPQELLSRVKAVLRFTFPTLHPLTHLPGIIACEKELEGLAPRKERFELLGMCLVNYELFKRGSADRVDALMEAVAASLYKELSAHGMKDFVGQVADDLFFLIAFQERGESLLKEIQKTFEASRKKLLYRSPLDFLKKTGEDVVRLQGEKLQGNVQTTLRFEEVQEELKKLKQAYSGTPTQLA